MDTDINWIDNIGSMLVTIYSNATDGSTCTDPTVVNNNGKLQITCTSPAKSAGTYNVDLELLRFNQKFTATNTIEYEYLPTLADITNMQEMTTAVCTNSAVGDTATLTDTRDNKTYTVKKLADNNCWMTQNLYLVGPLTLTPTDSNVTTNFSLPASSTSFGTTSDAAGINIARVNDTGRADYGAYYNWYTATASSGTYATAAGVSVSQSVCPKGWKLPTGGSGGEFQSLYGAYGNATDFISATSAVLSGYWGGSSAYGRGSYGYWWSRTAYSDVYGYRLNFSASNVDPQNGSKRLGYSVRCVAE